jgi:hypothetical protein
MAIANRGRPICRAVIDFTDDPDEELYNKFYKVCRTLSCSDMRKLARGLRVTLATVYFWRQGRSFPVTKGTAAFVIRWVEQGKPTEFVIQTPTGEHVLRRCDALN